MLDGSNEKGGPASSAESIFLRLNGYIVLGVLSKVLNNW